MIDEFENKLIKGIHASRYIASWVKSNGTMKRYLNEDNPSLRRLESYFADWLRSLVINGEHLTEDEVRYIDHFARNGKIELESSAKHYMEFKK